ncbi:cyclase family protein [Halalkalibacter akibai]|uniref:Metal-dependent hydrolase n=1 Tax=Halalkalibacter akibai (strain ATCC 43226 / DSM 21942 / CIP 109018 / JCM 9157 / 1139) TaxID=1236973 RepID=W4QN94_HALA3|nr:cyclase family protein [Halalkalibacter akibai]GAE33128.1 metal-dependent hydrolase [Halalkalibacter akibai JCM 9157]
MTSKIVDLTQEIYQGMPVLPVQQQTVIFSNVSHEMTKRKLGFEFATNSLIINEHSPTHSDAIFEYDPDGPTIDEMSLESFYGPAICLDVSHVLPDQYIKRQDLKMALQQSGQKIEEGDIVLLYTGHYERAYGKEDWFKRHPGLHYLAAKWLADLGVKNIGIDAPSIDHPEDSKFSGHLVCREYQITNTENLCNLQQVINLRFIYMGLPLKIRNGTGSPIRAVALLID